MTNPDIELAKPLAPKQLQPNEADEFCKMIDTRIVALKQHIDELLDLKQHIKRAEALRQSIGNAMIRHSNGQ